MEDRIKELISYLGMSTRNFAMTCGLKQNTLCNQLNGMRDISLQVVISILEHLPDVSAEWLLRGEGVMMKDSNIQSAEVSKLLGTIDALNGALSAQGDTIRMLQNRIKELENK